MISLSQVSLILILFVLAHLIYYFVNRLSLRWDSGVFEYQRLFEISRNDVSCGLSGVDITWTVCFGFWLTKIVLIIVTIDYAYCVTMHDPPIITHCSIDLIIGPCSLNSKSC